MGATLTEQDDGDTYGMLQHCSARGHMGMVSCEDEVSSAHTGSRKPERCTFTPKRLALLQLVLCLKRLIAWSRLALLDHSVPSPFSHIPESRISCDGATMVIVVKCNFAITSEPQSTSLFTT